MRTSRSLEMYFLDVGQGDAAFVVTPNGQKILVDGGLRDRALGFLIWKYRLDIPGNQVTIDHLFLSHADKDHVEGLIPLLLHPGITVNAIHHNGIGLFDSGFDTQLGDVTSNDDRLTTIHDSASPTSNRPRPGRRSSQRHVFGDWIQAVTGIRGPSYQTAAQFGTGTLRHRRPRDVTVEILGSAFWNPTGQSLPWFDDKAHTINGNSLVFRLTHDFVRPSSRET